MRSKVLVSVITNRLHFEVIINICDENSSELEFQQMSLQLNIDEEIIVNVNPIISEVFRNYISNVIKYAKNGEKIVIDAIVEMESVTINFKDFGDTIKKGDRENVFVRSVQLGDTKGSGLGLAIVKRIADAHGAEVGVKPNKPKGNNFYITIPVL